MHLVPGNITHKMSKLVVYRCVTASWYSSTTCPIRRSPLECSICFPVSTPETCCTPTTVLILHWLCMVPGNNCLTLWSSQQLIIIINQLFSLHTRWLVSSTKCTDDILRRYIEKLEGILWKNIIIFDTTITRYLGDFVGNFVYVFNSAIIQSESYHPWRN